MEKLHDGEPWFFLRAQDGVAAVAAVESYANALGAAAKLCAISTNPDLEPTAENLHAQSLECFEIAEAMRVWQRENPELVKIPD